jgi:hypothetical protein
MPLHDFYHCGQVVADVYRSVEEGACARPPLCPTCQQSMTWLPQTCAMDVGGVKGAAFKAFDTTDGRGTPVHIDSLRKLRQVERESETHARNGEGQPMIFRRWAQGDSNKDQPTLSQTYNGGEQPSKAAAHRFGSTLRKSAEAPDHQFGPGVSESNTSALPVK